jgi:hypothetical protein
MHSRPVKQDATQAQLPASFSVAAAWAARVADGPKPAAATIPHRDMRQARATSHIWSGLVKSRIPMLPPRESREPGVSVSAGLAGHVRCRPSSERARSLRYTVHTPRKRIMATLPSIRADPITIYTPKRARPKERRTDEMREPCESDAAPADLQPPSVAYKVFPEPPPAAARFTQQDERNRSPQSNTSINRRATETKR